MGQALIWRWDVHWLTALTNSQFLWVLLCFLVAWGWSRGRLLPGAVAGAATGFALIASYYGVQWLVGGEHAATAQFTDSYGLAWTAASVIGGAGVGLLGALAAADAATRPRRKAFGLISAAVILAGGPVAWVALGGPVSPEGTGIAASAFVCVGLGLLWAALRRCGPLDTVRGGAPAVALAAGLLVILYVLQHTLLYLTY